MIICRNFDEGDTINSVCEWFDKCSLTRRVWVDGRSAKELAKYWCNAAPNIPSEFKEFLEEIEEFSGIQILIGSPEYEAKFDQFKDKKGRPKKGSNHDLFLICEQNEKKVVIGIEAKVNEPFGDKTTGETYWSEDARKPDSDLKPRIEQLLSALFGTVDIDQYGDIRYQLLYTPAGVLAEAKRKDAKKALFAVNTFKTELMEREKHVQNLTDLNFFVHKISSGTCHRIENGSIIGPFRVPGNDYIPSDVSLYIGRLDISPSEEGGSILQI